MKFKEYLEENYETKDGVTAKFKVGDKIKLSDGTKGKVSAVNWVTNEKRWSYSIKGIGEFSEDTLSK